MILNTLFKRCSLLLLCLSMVEISVEGTVPKQDHPNATISLEEIDVSLSNRNNRQEQPTTMQDRIKRFVIKPLITDLVGANVFLLFTLVLIHSCDKDGFLKICGGFCVLDIATIVFCSLICRSKINNLKAFYHVVEHATNGMNADKKWNTKDRQEAWNIIIRSLSRVNKHIKNERNHISVETLLGALKGIIKKNDPCFISSSDLLALETALITAGNK